MNVGENKCEAIFAAKRGDDGRSLSLGFPIVAAVLGRLKAAR